MREAKTHIKPVEDLLGSIPKTHTPPTGPLKEKTATDQPARFDLDPEHEKYPPQSAYSAQNQEEIQDEEDMAQMSEAIRLVDLALALATDAERRERLSGDAYKGAMALVATACIARLPRAVVIVLSATSAVLGYLFQERAKKDREAGKALYESSVESLPASFRERIDF